MSSSFWYLSWRNKLISNRVLIIWTKTEWKWKIANVTIHWHTQLLSYHLLYTVVEWLHLQFFKTHLSLFLNWLELCYLSTNSLKFAIKMRTFTCIPIYAFNLPYMMHFCENSLWSSIKKSLEKFENQVLGHVKKVKTKISLPLWHVSPKKSLVQLHT